MNRFEIVAAYAYAAERYYSGQWSKGYRILSRISRMGFRPGASLYNDPDIRSACAQLLWTRRHEIRRTW